jgi:hypothetical protein
MAQAVLPWLNIIEGINCSFSRSLRPQVLGALCCSSAKRRAAFTSMVNSDPEHRKALATQRDKLLRRSRYCNLNLVPATVTSATSLTVNPAIIMTLLFAIMTVS